MSLELPHLLVVDDDARLRRLLARYLSEHGYLVATAEDAADARGKLGSFAFDLIVLDLMMPGESGLSFAADLRKRSGVPILMLTAMGEPEDRIAGLEGGADDYMVKPFSLDELSARLRALTRRSRPDQETGAETLTFADLVMDLSTREVSRGGRRISLTRTEFALLQTFMEHPRHVLERGWLLNEVWGFDFPTTANSLDVYIGYLRRKTEQEGEPRLIHTIRTVGYVLRETPP